MTAPHGFPRQRRLLRAAEFGRVFGRSQRSSDKLFTIVARANQGQGARLGLAISKRAAKRAVDRNRLKRLAREVFRLQQNLPSLDFVVLAGVDACKANRTDLRTSLERHFERLTQQRGPRDHG